MKKFQSVFNRIVNQSYDHYNNVVDNKFYDMLKEDIDEFIQSVSADDMPQFQQDNDYLLEEFLNFADDYECDLINLDVVKQKLFEKFESVKNDLRSQKEQMGFDGDDQDEQ